METHQGDRRVARTRTKLVDALLELIVEQGYAAVTIRDLTERAQVGYATFFRHYADKGALLLDALDLFVAELVALLQRTSGAEGGEETGRLLFTFVAQRAELSRVFLLSRANQALMDRLFAAGVQSIHVSAQPRPDARIPADLAAYHVVSATLSLIQWWLEQDMPYSPEEMGRLYHLLVLQPAQALAFLPTGSSG